jgi:hypothetical protein
MKGVAAQMSLQQRKVPSGAVTEVHRRQRVILKVETNMIIITE